MSLRINMFGGPGSSKSTTAAWLFSELKTFHYSVELVNEYVKSWAISKRPVQKYDQIYLFGKQLQYEYRYLSNGIKNIVSDSPTLLASVYARKYIGDEMGNCLEKLNQIYEKEFPSLNIFLNRKDKKYIQEGRYQTKEQAVEIDQMIKEAAQKQYSKTNNFFEIDYNNRPRIIELVLEHIEK